MLNNNHSLSLSGLDQEAETRRGGDVVQLRFQPEEPIEAEDAAHYLSEMLIDMRVIAAKSGFKFLAALIEVAAEEARLQMVKKQQFADIA